MARVQILRAFAAVMVVCYHETVRAQQLLHHTLLGHAFALGGAGVDTFFVISGFIIYSVHRRDIGHPASLRPYLIKRFVRIYPIYWLVTLAILPMYLSGYGLGSKRSLPVLLKSLLLVPQHPGTFPVLNVGWTLSFEVLFYLMFALAIGCRRRWITGLVWSSWLVPCAVLTGLRLSGAWSPPGGSLITGFLFSERNLEFVLGCGVAWLVGRFQLPAPRALVAAGLALFLGLELVASLHPGVHPLGDDALVLFGLPSVLMVAGAAHLDRHARSRPPAPLVRLGDASYALYLLHFVVVTAAFIALRHLGLDSGVIVTAYAVVVLVGSCLLAVVVFRLVELPLIGALRRWLLPVSGPGARR